jgi:DNA polymerase-3 subunit epsilon
MQKSRVFLDLETTGVNRTSSRIVEIGIVYVDGNGVETEYTKLINPGGPIPQEVVDIHGISDEHVKDAPEFADVAKEIYELVTKADEFIAYNFMFDFQILQNEFKRAGYTLEERAFIFYDPLKIFRKYSPHNLETAYLHYTGKPLTKAHRALDDIKATKEVFEKQGEIYQDLLPMDPKTEIIGDWFNTDDRGKIVFAKGKHRLEVVNNYSHGKYLSWLGTLEDLTDSEKRYIIECTGKK